MEPSEEDEEDIELESDEERDKGDNERNYSKQVNLRDASSLCLEQGGRLLIVRLVSHVLVYRLYEGKTKCLKIITGNSLVMNCFASKRIRENCWRAALIR